MGFRKGDMRTSIYRVVGATSRGIFRNVGDEESRESVFLRSALYRKVRQVAYERVRI